MALHRGRPTAGQIPHLTMESVAILSTSGPWITQYDRSPMIAGPTMSVGQQRVSPRNGEGTEVGC